MSDDFERRVAAAMRAPVPADARAKRRVMDAVRRASVEGAPSARRHSGGGGPSRHSIIGLALAAGIGGLSTLAGAVPSMQPHDSRVLSSIAIGDSVVSTLRDTLRMVRLMLDAPGAHRVAVAGDFNRWGAPATPLVRDAYTPRWSVTLALRSGEHRYAFVVDGTRWVLDPHVTEVARGDDGRLYSLLSVARATN